MLLFSIVVVVLGFAFAFLLWGCTFICFLLGRGCGFGESGWQPEFKSPKADLLDDGFEIEEGVINAVALGELHAFLEPNLVAGVDRIHELAAEMGVSLFSCYERMFVPVEQLDEGGHCL